MYVSTNSSSWWILSPWKAKTIIHLKVKFMLLSLVVSLAIGTSVDQMQWQVSHSFNFFSVLTSLPYITNLKESLGATPNFQIMKESTIGVCLLRTHSPCSKNSFQNFYPEWSLTQSQLMWFGWHSTHSAGGGAHGTCGSSLQDDTQRPSLPGTLTLYKTLLRVWAGSIDLLLKNIKQ